MSKIKKIILLVLLLVLIIVISGYYADMKKNEIESKYQSDQKVFQEMLEHKVD